VLAKLLVSSFIRFFAKQQLKPTKASVAEAVLYDLDFISGVLISIIIHMNETNVSKTTNLAIDFFNFNKFFHNKRVF